MQQPIPIWIGAFEPPALRRVGRLADGWFPMARPRGGLEEALEIIHAAAAEAGRDMSGFEFEGRLEYQSRDVDKMVDHAARWKAAGATHLAVNTMHAGLPDTDAHIGAITEIAAALL